MTTTLGILGSGAIGGSIARLAVAAGYDVVLSNSRGPESLAPLVQELGPRARAATPADAAEAADLVVAAVPFRLHVALPAQQLVGKPVVDTMNYFPEFDGIFPELDERRTTSSELVQSRLPGAHVVKALGNQFAGHIVPTARPSGDPERSTLPVSGDDADAKAAVRALVEALGFDNLDNGSLAESWRHEAGTPVNVLPWVRTPPADAAPAELAGWVDRTPPVVPVAAQQIRELLDAATRTGRVGGASADWAHLL